MVEVKAIDSDGKIQVFTSPNNLESDVSEIGCYRITYLTGPRFDALTIPWHGRLEVSWVEEPEEKVE